MTEHHAAGTFEVHDFAPVDGAPDSTIATTMASGIATMQKSYAGDVAGRSETIFVGTRDELSGAGAYVALETFEGSLHGRAGAFHFVHVAATRGSDRYAEHFAIVEGSGTAELTGIRGAGALQIDDDGTHRMVFDYDLG